MSKNLMSKQFYTDNPLDKNSSEYSAYTMVTALWDDTLWETMENKLSYMIEPDRLRQRAAERAQIAQLKGGDEAVKFIRGGYDEANRIKLARKLLAMQAEMIPPLLRRYRTSGQDVLIDTAYSVFSHAEPGYIDQLIELYPEIRDPHARSLACLVFGLQEREETLPLLQREYERLKKEYPDDSYAQGPLIAIYVLDGELKPWSEDDTKPVPAPADSGSQSLYIVYEDPFDSPDFTRSARSALDKTSRRRELYDRGAD